MLVMFIIIYYCCGVGVEDDLVGYGLCCFKLEIYIVGFFQEDDEDEGMFYVKVEEDDNVLSWL